MTVSPRSRPTQVVGRHGDGPVQGRFEVVGHRRDGAYRVLTVSAPEVARRARPGQFVEIGVDAPTTLLRRPFSVAEASTGGPGGGTVTVVYDVHGQGTEWLSKVEVHDQLDLLGPLGGPFPVPSRSVSVMLVAGGYGAAPVYWFAGELQRGGHRVDIVVGAADSGRIHGAIEAKRTSTSATFTTEDGSLGVQGRVTDVLAERIEACGTDVVYAIGPMPMLRAVAEVCDEVGVACQVAVEEHMACGIGVCWTCVVPTRGEDGGVVNRRACVDGPVFDAASVDWEASRWTTGPEPEPEEEPAPPPARPTSRELFG